MTFRRRWRATSIVAATLLLLMVVSTGIAQEDGPIGRGGQTADAGADVLVVRQGSGAHGAKFLTQTNDTTTTSTSFVNLTSTTVNVASNHREFLDIRFSGESACTGGDAGFFDYCIVRILVDGVEAHPQSGFDDAFDSTDDSTETIGSWEHHAMERVSNCLTPGNHTVTVQWATTFSNVTFWLGDWTLGIEKVHLAAC